MPFPSFAEWAAIPFEDAALRRFAAQLDELKATADEKTLGDAVRLATKWAAVNTGAIEGLYQVDRGFTYSVAVSSAAWESIHVQKGEFAAASISDAVKAYDFVLDAATGSHPITEVWLRTLHETVAASQENYSVVTAVGSQEQALPKGEYKKYPNNPLNYDSNVVHSYAPPMDTPSEMARLMEEMRSAEFHEASAVLQAAYAHYAFVSVHPFADGNGRVARALAATFLYRGMGVPLVIFADQKADYLDALEAADMGEPALFLRFVSERVIDTIAMIKEQVLTAATPSIDEQMVALRQKLNGRDGLTHAEIDAITLRVRDAFSAALQKQVSENPLEDPLSALAMGSVGVGYNTPPQGYRFVPSDMAFVGLAVQSAAPASGSTVRYYTAMTRLPSSDNPGYAVVSNEGNVIFTAETRDVHPTIGQAFFFRAEAAALRELRVLTEATTVQAEASLRQAGYL